MAKLRQRLGREEGFTLIELLIVLVILGILLAIAVPAYLGFKDKAANRSAEADVRSAVPSAEAYFESYDTYAGMTAAKLRAIDEGLSKYLTVDGAKATTDSYCLGASVAGKSWSVHGPGLNPWWDGTTNCTGTSTTTP